MNNGPTVRRCKHALAIALLSTLSVLGSPPGAVAQIPTGPDGVTGTFGETSNRGIVDESNGAMTYSMPLDLPAARGNAQPTLALRYRSNSGTGDAGEDWSLDLPTIERAPLSNWPKYVDNGHEALEDRYTYSGRVLAYVCTVGVLPGCPVEAGPMPAWARGHRHYRLRVDRGAERFFLSPSRQRWLVQYRGGQIMEFGEPLTQASVADAAVDREPTAGNKIFRWNLARHYDLHGIETAASSGALGLATNVVVYKWSQSTTARNVLTDIFYTPPAANPTHATLSEHAYHVALDWEQSGVSHPAPFGRTDKQRPSQRLRRVAIAAAPWGQPGPREIVRQYHFTYYHPRFVSAGDAPLWYRSFLHQVEIEGRCGGVESNNIIPATTCPRLPAQIFEYESAHIAIGTVIATDISGSPAGGLPYPGNTAIVDIDRDGRPDIVQGWPQNYQIHASAASSAAAWYNACKPNDTSSGRVGVWVHVTENGPGQPRVLLCPYTDAPQIMGPARRQDAYVNRGVQANGTLTLQHNCLDADALAAVQAPPSPPDFLGGSPVALFSQFGSQVLGPWGDAVLLWSKANRRGFAIDATSADPAFCPSAASNVLYPALKWRQTDDSWWAKSPAVGSLQAGVYVDIDGDGYIDRLGTASGTSGPFGRAGIAFTRRLSEFEATESNRGPALVPFVSNLSAIPVGYDDGALGPPGESWYADVNGDGLVDLISVSANPQALPGSRLEIRPGNGRGHFGCTPAEGCFVAASSNEVSWLGDAYAASIDVALPFLVQAWGYPLYADPIGPHPTLFVHDVTGDGLADLVVIHFALGPNGAQTPRVRLWVNIDGHHFMCANPADDCTVGTFSGTAPAPDNASPLALNVTFADVNANGVDDLVILGETTIWHFSFLTVPSVPASGGRRAPRPGLLTHVRSGAGADTDIVYQTIQELDVEASTYLPYNFDNFLRPWTTHVPVVLPVVTRVTVRDTPTASGSPLQQPFLFARETRFTYRDPAYDLWTRSFKGFARVRAERETGETVQTWRWFTACERGRVEDSQPQRPVCPETSDRAGDAAFVGLPVRVDRFFPGSGPERPTQWLSTKTFRYAIEPDPLINSTQVWRRADLDRIDEYLYDTTAEISRADAISAPNTIQRAPEQPAGRVRLVTSMSYNTEGSRTGAVRCGRTNATGDCGSLIDSEITEAVLPTFAGATWCRGDWRCQPTGMEVRERRRDDTGDIATTVLRQQRFEYGPDPSGTDFNGDLVNLYSQLLYPGIPGLPHHASRDLSHGVGFPPSASTLVGERQVMSIVRDAFGTPTQVLGAPGSQQPCVAYVLDPIFAQFSATVIAYVGASCTGPTLEHQLVFDRGLGQVTAIVDQQRRTLETLEYDAFGRFHKRFVPHAEVPYATLLALQIDHFLQSPTPYLVIKQPLYEPNADPGTLASIEIFNGIGEHVLGFDTADSSAYGAPWILRDWTERDASGAVTAVNRPLLFFGDPYTVAATAPPLTPHGTRITAVRDVFGRPRTIADASTIVADYRYLPLQVEIRDAEQAKPSGLYSGNFSRSTIDGHGRPIQSQRQEGSRAIITTVDFLATGEPRRVCRHSFLTGPTPPLPAPLCDAPGAYVRKLQWDSFGRLVQNDEPNTSRVSGTDKVGWSYTYDDSGRLVATTDARGCGKNIYYDTLGRVLAEDFSPCDASQPAYTPPDLTTGDGTEVFYRYDRYEPGHPPPTAGFAGRAESAARNLVSVQDRGAHTRFSYDARGRLRRVERRLVKPGIPAATLTDRYATSWFAEMLTYDDSDRLRRRTTTLRTPELLVNGESAETFDYVGFLISNVGSSYGTLASTFRYLPNHALSAMTYADAASTRATFDYDDRDRLWRYHLFRHAAPAVWSTSRPLYPLPGPETTQLDLSLNYLTYDDVGNPISITDESTSTWPTGARPVSRLMRHDAAYRVMSVQSVHGGDGHVPAYLAEALAGDRHPVAVRQGSQRPSLQTFEYDWQGDTTFTDDDEGLRYDRSLGLITNGGTSAGPNQLVDAAGVHADYDFAGNLIELTVARTSCWDKMPNCSHRFRYDWNEVGQLVRARRWDYRGGPVPPPLPNEVPTWDLAYVYSSGQRVLKTVTDALGVSKHTLDASGTQRISRADYDPVSSDYQVQGEDEIRFVAGLGRVFHDPARLMPVARADGMPIHVFLTLGDHLGSTAFTIDKDSGEVVERSMHQPFGAIESDLRPLRWAGPREDFKFTGKEDDIEVGLTYFGARYYQAQLGRWASADPLSIHALGGDINPYAYVSGRVMSVVDPLGLGGDEYGPDVFVRAPPRKPREPTHDWAPVRDRVPLGPQTPIQQFMWQQFARFLGRNGDFERGARDQALDSVASSFGPITGPLVREGLPPASSGPPSLAYYWGRAPVLGMELYGGAVVGSLFGTLTESNAIITPITAEGTLSGIRPSQALITDIGVCGRTNCFNRAIALERRLAGSPTSAIGGEETLLSDAYAYLKEIYPSGTTLEFGSRGPMEDIFQLLGEGTRGVVCGIRATETGHAFNAVVLNGRVVFMDAVGPASLAGYSKFGVFFTQVGGGL